MRFSCALQVRVRGELESGRCDGRSYKSATAKRCKNAAHGVSRGVKDGNQRSPSGAKPYVRGKENDLTKLVSKWEA